MDLGRLQRVDIRKVWKHEASNFTPWLADNLMELGAVLGMELERDSEEVPIGSFSLDLLAREVGTGREVIVENQLETTDHDHLGKLLTYAAGRDSRVNIWIAREFKDEHRQALDWLSQHTDEDTEFFGVIVEVWSIDKSRPAPHFIPIITPNRWQRTIRSKSTSPKQRQYQEFFQHLIDVLRERNFTNARSAQARSFYFFTSGSGPRFRYGASFALGSRVRVELNIFGVDKEWNKRVFDQLLAQKESIQRSLKTSLDWERLDEKKASRIAIYRDGKIDDEKDELAKVQKWLVESLIAFKQTFEPILKDLNNSPDPLTSIESEEFSSEVEIQETEE